MVPVHQEKLPMELTGPWTGSGGARGVYLVVMREMVIAEDLRGAIGEWDRTALVEIVPDLASADAALAGLGGSLKGAFVMASPQAYGASALAAQMGRLGRLAVLLGEEAEREGGGETYVVLTRPFATSDVLRLLGMRAAIA
jgi:hypothetical protein